MSSSPPVGSYGLARVRGVVGFLIALGQLLMGRPSRWCHAFLVLPGGKVIEAEPGGARIRPIGVYLQRARLDGDVVFTDAPVQRELAARKAEWAAVALDDVELATWLGEYEEFLRAEIAVAGAKLRGRPYGFLDYASIILGRWRIRPAWVLARVQSSDTLICSQLVDVALTGCGLTVVDGRPFSGDVIPADLGAVRERWDAQVAGEWS